ncbi:right-handed parallel beta-helix repeat-containing protein [Neobacillus drentensis]|uniref:right-handed parallel beta-helix repeat-containing protein n=1 Tax=Neobacillus drentensis TaxID=220684 RepID=UPI003002EEC6
MSKRKLHKKTSLTIIFLLIIIFITAFTGFILNTGNQNGDTGSQSKKVNEKINPVDYGAVGDGITDDTVALQEWLNAPGKNKVLKNGTFKITEGLTSTENGRTIKTDGAVIVAEKTDIIILTVTGNKNKISVKLNGNNKAAGGVLIKGAGSEVTNSKIENIYGRNHVAYGIRSETSGGIRVENNIINNIHSTSNGIFGDSIGASRAIFISSTQVATSMNIVKNNSIIGVTGEEGDAIQFLFNGGTKAFLDAKGIIQGNTIKNCSRRAIKVQASNVKVLNNTHSNTLSINFLPNALNLIDIIHSNNVIVQGNTLDARSFQGISLNGDSTNKSYNIVVKRNVIRGGLTLSNGTRATTNGIYWSNVKDSEIISNSISATIIPISGSNGTNIIIANNHFWGGDVLNPAIYLVSSNSNISVSNNKQMSGNRLNFIKDYTHN